MDQLTYVGQRVAVAKHLIILAGAGMSSALGVPTYWTGPDAQYGGQSAADGYTALEHATGQLWTRKPAIQHRYHMHRHAQLTALNPLASHYGLLAAYLTTRALDHFIVTSNVDGFFMRSGIDQARLYEVHGAHHRSQCLRHPRKHGVFETCDRCPSCGAVTRPNILFFNDRHMNPQVLRVQADGYMRYVNEINPAQTIALEIGAGATVPTIRRMSEKLAACGIQVVRINPNQPAKNHGNILAVLATAEVALPRILI